MDKVQFHFLSAANLKIIEADSTASLGGVLARLGSNVGECTVWVARAVTTATPQTTLQELDLRTGDCLLTVNTSTPGVKLTLIAPDQRHALTLTKSEALIGCRDDALGFTPDVDLTPWLRHPARISPRQAVLADRGGRWQISLAAEARAPAFVDRQRLEVGCWLEVRDGAIISFGNSPEQPEVRLQVRLE